MYINISIGIPEKMDEIIEKIMSNNIDELNLNKYRMQYQQLSCFITPLTTNMSLLILNLSGDKLGNEGAIKIAKILTTNYSLHTLNLSECCIRDKGMIEIASSLTTNTSLRTLNLNYNSIGRAGSHLSIILRNNASLHTLKFNYNYVDNNDAIKIASSLITNTTLQKLCLRGNFISCIGSIEFAKLLMINVGLLTLDMGENYIEEKGANEIIKSLTVNTTLHKLYLNYNKLGLNTAMEIASVLTTNMLSLQSLYLRGTDMESKGTIKILESLAVNTSLRTLDLGHNNMGIEVFDAIKLCLVTNESLRTLNLDDNMCNNALHTLNNNELTDKTTDLVKIFKLNYTLTNINLGINNEKINKILIRNKKICDEKKFKTTKLANGDE